MEAEPGAGPASYRAAADELDQILADLDDDHLDVDVLAGKVRRAAELISFCRARISAARMEVEQVVADLDPPSAPVTGPAGDTVAASPKPSPDDDPTLLASPEDAPTQVTPTSDRSDPAAAEGS